MSREIGRVGHIQYTALGFLAQAPNGCLPAPRLVKAIRKGCHHTSPMRVVESLRALGLIRYIPEELSYIITLDGLGARCSRSKLSIIQFVSLEAVA